MFTDLRSPRDVTGYTLYRGTTDWTQLQQFDLFETGYPYLVMVSIPDFLSKMAAMDTEVATLVNSYKHIIEYEFTGLDSGIDDISRKFRRCALKNCLDCIDDLTDEIDHALIYNI